MAQRTILCRHWGHLLAQLCAGLLVLPSLCEEMGVYCSKEAVWIWAVALAAVVRRGRMSLPECITCRDDALLLGKERLIKK